jgi:hypothetical protein
VLRWPSQSRRERNHCPVLMPAIKFPLSPSA